MKKLFVTLIVLAIGSLVLNACYYDEVPVFVGLPTNVSLKNDVKPIFSRNCTTTGCHDAVPSHAPSLTEANIYNSLINGNYVNISDPEKSTIYQTMLNGGMPPSGPLSSNELKVVLGWIAEGAKNN